jgi:hypothetical protein
VLRGEDRVRSAYREQVERYLGQLERLLGGDADARARRRSRSAHWSGRC